MKKALTKVLLTVITLVIFAAIIPLSASASTEDNKNEIFRILTTKLDLNPAAACGIMANMEKESSFDSTVVIIDSNGLPSGGLCQWNGGRFSNLKNYCSKNGYDYLTIEGQLAYLQHEISSSYYKHIYDYLKSRPNTASGAYDAAWYWCYYFEIPANASTKAAQRGSVAQNTYWPDFGIEDLKAPQLSFQNKKNPYDIDNAIDLKWSDGGDDVTNYYLYVAPKKSNGKYDWAKASITKLGSATTTKTVAAKTLKKGNYAACVRAYSSRADKYINSNFAKFTVKCLSHQLVNTVIEPATFTKEGQMRVTCKQCDAYTTKSIPKLTNADFKTLRVSGFKIASYSNTKIKFKWNTVDGADGYQLYLKQSDGSWKKIKTIWDPDCKEYIVSELEPGTKYFFKFRAFKCGGNDTYFYTKTTGEVIAATRPEGVVVGNITQGTGTAKLTWSTVEGVDGYAVYMAEGQDSSDFKLLSKVEKSTSSAYTAKNLKKGQFYYFTVKSYIKTTSGYAVSPSSEIMYIVAK